MTEEQRRGSAEGNAGSPAGCAGAGREENLDGAGFQGEEWVMNLNALRLS